MERVFTEDVHREDGTVKWPKGLISGNYRSETWDDIATVVGKPLDEFTKPIEDAATSTILAQAAAMGDAGQPDSPVPAPAGPAPAPVREPPSARKKRNR